MSLRAGNARLEILNKTTILTDLETTLDTASVEYRAAIQNGPASSAEKKQVADEMMQSKENAVAAAKAKLDVAANNLREACLLYTSDAADE